MITSLADIPAGRPLEFDIVIVGGGAAGITLALELDGSGKRVAVLEGGGQAFDPLSQARYAGPLELGDGLGYLPLDLCRLRFLGGSTNHWGGWCRPLESNVFGPRPGVSDLAWPFDRSELDDQYRRANELCEVGRHEYDAQTVFADLATSPAVAATDVLRHVVWRFSPPTHFGVRYGSALEASPAEVFLGANCVGLDIVDGRVRAVEVLSEARVAHRFTAAHVVLASGGIENVRHLLIAASDVPDLDRSGLLGRGFMEHPHADIGYVTVDATDLENDGRFASSPFLFDTDGTRLACGLTLTEDVLASKGLPNVSFTFGRASDERAADIPSAPAVRTLWGATLPRGGAAFMSIVGRSEQRFSIDSRIMLTDERDDLGVPRAGLSWRVSDADMNAIDVARDILFRELLEQGFGPVSSGPLARTVTGGSHHMGGANMHEDPTRGVVDADLRCHAVDNLFIAGSAVFPTACFSNPTLTIVALAVRLAQHLRELS